MKLLNIKTDQKLFFSSDFHAYHKNIVSKISTWRNEFGEIPLEQVRPFENEQIMTQQLIENINKKVGENDWLIHLGDWSFGGLENIYKFRKQINCKNIINVNGNHDQHIGEGKKLYFETAHFDPEYPKGIEVNVDWSFHAIYDKLIVKYGKHHFVCSHMPFLCWDNISKGWMNLHGHLHNKGEGRFLSHNQMDVGVCGNPNFEPYSVEEILELIKENNEKIKNFQELF